MSDTIYLEAVPGRLLSIPGRPGHFYGLARAREGNVEPVVHSVPGGHDYVRGPAFAAPARAHDGQPTDIFLRRALQRGDLARAAQPAAPKRRPVADPKE